MNRWAGLVVMSLMPALVLAAQPLRDPTQLPAAARSTGEGTSVAKPSELAVDTGNVAVLVRAGTPYLVLGTRLFAAGQRVGAARIERITESEIWLREAGKLNKIRVFQGVDKSVSSPLSKH